MGPPVQRTQQGTRHWEVHAVNVAKVEYDAGDFAVYGLVALAYECFGKRPPAMTTVVTGKRIPSTTLGAIDAHTPTAPLQ